MDHLSLIEQRLPVLTNSSIRDNSWNISGTAALTRSIRLGGFCGLGFASDIQRQTTFLRARL